jgi:hypothetical protein
MAGQVISTTLALRGCKYRPPDVRSRNKDWGFRRFACWRERRKRAEQRHGAGNGPFSEKRAVTNSVRSGLELRTERVSRPARVAIGADNFRSRTTDLRHCKLSWAQPSSQPMGLGEGGVCRFALLPWATLLISWPVNLRGRQSRAEPETA